MEETSVRIDGSPRYRMLWACVVGAALGYGTLGIALFGQLVTPLSQALGRSQDEVGFAFSTMAVGSIIGPPIAGALIDRFGSRVVISASGLFMGAIFVALSRVAMLPQLYILYGLLALLGSGTLVVAYSRPIVTAFTHRRGAALGVMLAAIGVATALLPAAIVAILHRWSIEGAFLFLGGLAIVAIVPSALFLPGKKDEIASSRPVARTRFLKDHVLSPVGLTLVGTGLLLGVFTSGVWSQAVPMLGRMGVTDSGTATVMGCLALILTVTRLLAGVSMDRFFAPYVGVALLLPVALAWTAFAVFNDPIYAILAILISGLGVGVEFDLFSYLVSKYMPPEVYSSFFGVLYSSVSIGLAAGPLLFALVRRSGAADAGPSVLIAIMTAGACFLLLRLPSFPKLGEAATASSGESAEAVPAV